MELLKLLELNQLVGLGESSGTQKILLSQMQTIMDCLLDWLKKLGLSYFLGIYSDGNGPK